MRPLTTMYAGFFACPCCRQHCLRIVKAQWIVRVRTRWPCAGSSVNRRPGGATQLSKYSSRSSFAVSGNRRSDARIDADSPRKAARKFTIVFTLDDLRRRSGKSQAKGFEVRGSQALGALNWGRLPAVLVRRDRRRPPARSGHPGRGQPAYRGRHHPILHAGATRRPVRSRPAGPQPEDALRHRPVPGCQLHAQGNTLVVHVVENPIVNQVAFEGNHKMTTTSCGRICSCVRAAVFTPAMAEADRQHILDVYSQKRLLRHIASSRRSSVWTRTASTWFSRSTTARRR